MIGEYDVIEVNRGSNQQKTGPGPPPPQPKFSGQSSPIYVISPSKCYTLCLVFSLCMSVIGLAASLFLMYTFYFGSAKDKIPNNCSALATADLYESGVYLISPSDGSQFKVYCQNGWTVFQRRENGLESFDRKWEEYKKGFGDLNGDFWLGTETIYNLIKDGQFELRIDLENLQGERTYAIYQNFSLDATKNYTLWIGSYNGTANDSLTSHRDLPFSINDYQNNTTNQSGWWFSKTGKCNLNGIYQKATENLKENQLFHWESVGVNSSSLKSSEMKFRQVKK